ncbi:hypothetical protein AVEN_143948-1 [Araneus ventricosus]|uniref:Uncharacterized protein n=1 Tax=Araneus ventricosus TaxID=182803 RepID=A0A4Y2SMS3_ARAVE|nr:hypothetical protein AVEN_143948-1 [Araneus ventricosus]
MGKRVSLLKRRIQGFTLRPYVRCKFSSEFLFNRLKPQSSEAHSHSKAMCIIGQILLVLFLMLSFENKGSLTGYLFSWNIEPRRILAAFVIFPDAQAKKFFQFTEGTVHHAAIALCPDATVSKQV